MTNKLLSEIKGIDALSASLPDYTGILSRNRWKFLVGKGENLIRVLLGSIRPLYVIGVYRFVKHCVRIIRKNGSLFLVKRLKAEQMLLMQIAANQETV